MGTSTARIAATDFLTPAELRDRPLAGNPAGRVGGTRLELVATREGTRLGACYQQVPVRVLPPFGFNGGAPSLLYLLNPTAGLLDGDAHLIEITARRGTRAVVAGQSATRIHPSARAFATQQWHIHVEADAVLVVLPGPTIPFQGCRYYQYIAIDLDPGGVFIWGDIWFAGRYARGIASEQFVFDTLIQDLTVRRGGSLVFRDRFAWHGPWDADTAAWHFGGAPASGSLFATVPSGRQVLPDLRSIEGATFLTSRGDSCFRCHGSSEAVCAAVIRGALGMASVMTGGNPCEPWLLSSDTLAPNHWFNGVRPP
jgi:urease accessory protein